MQCQERPYITTLLKPDSYFEIASKTSSRTMHGNCLIAHGAEVSHTGIPQHCSISVIKSRGGTKCVFFPFSDIL